VGTLRRVLHGKAEHDLLAGRFIFECWHVLLCFGRWRESPLLCPSVRCTEHVCGRNREPKRRSERLRSLHILYIVCAPAKRSRQRLGSDIIAGYCCSRCDCGCRCSCVGSQRQKAGQAVTEKRLIPTNSWIAGVLDKETPYQTVNLSYPSPTPKHFPNSMVDSSFLLVLPSNLRAKFTYQSPGRLLSGFSRVFSGGNSETLLFLKRCMI